MTDFEKLRMTLTNSLWRASRYKRATSLKKYLLWDLEYIEEQTTKALELLERIEDR